VRFGCTVVGGHATEPWTPASLPVLKRHMVGICEAGREIDLCTAPAFAAAMRAEIDWADNRAVFIDCAGIIFMDSAAFHALVDAHRYAIEHGHLLVIRNLRPNCARAMRMCDRKDELTIDE
jgi:anti-anti-sigma factor